MRRKEKYITGGFACGAGITALVDIGMQWYEHHQRGEKFTWESYDGGRTLERSLVGGAIGGGVGYGLYYYRRMQERNQPFEPNEYLKKVLGKERFTSDVQLVKKAEKYRTLLKNWISSEFGESLASSPEDSGSYYKRTMIASNFDLDIIVPFKRGVHLSLKDMADDLYKKVQKKFGSKATVIKQTRSAGLCFVDGGDEIYIDIVPGREINNYKKDGLLNLYVRPDFFWQSGTSFKTNIRIQQFIPVNTYHIRSVIMLLKIYRDKFCPELPVIHIEMAAAQAIQKNGYGIHSCLRENLLNAMDMLSIKLNQHALTDKANSNNNLNDKISSYERSSVKDLLLDDIKKIEDDPRYLKEIFEL